MNSIDSSEARHAATNDAAVAEATVSGIYRLEWRLINEFQRDFPLVPQPYAAIANALGISEQAVLQALERLTISGEVSRIGPVLKPDRLGMSTLAAMSVPPQELERVSTTVGSFPQVTDSREREHRFNLWFVVTAASGGGLSTAIRQIERATGLRVHSLPTLVDRAKRLGPGVRAAPQHSRHQPAQRPPWTSPACRARRLLARIQHGLALAPRPYAALAAETGSSEGEVLDTLRGLCADGTIERMGLIARRGEPDRRVEAMVVWDIDDEYADEIGHSLARYPAGIKCYRCARSLPAWPYNVCCVIYGRNRETVIGHIRRIVVANGLADTPAEVLFGGRRFK
jgi:DNA-binding Lrp family transcriptional regulator